MNVFKTFEQRMNTVFGASPQGFAAPISFKRLAKRTAREMENETYVVDGINTAPALYTVLVSSSDDATMHALYPEITSELADCVEAEAARKGYEFVGAPLVRFMVDPSLRSGKFAVFAENVDARTLERLRREEEAFLSEASTIGGAASALSAAPAAEIAHGGRGRGKRRRGGAAGAVETMPVVEPAPVLESEELEPRGAHAAGAHAAAPVADALPTHDPYAAQPVAAQPAEAPAPVEPVAPASRVPQLSSEHLREIPVADPVAIPVTNPSFADDSAGLGVIPADFLDGAYANLQASAEPALPLMSEAAPVPVTTRRPSVQPAPVAAPVVPPEPVRPSCRLINHQTGEVHTITDTQAVLGRERSAGTVVLRDPNVSRRHALVSFDGRGWRIQDLQSTNGTLVNDIDINECALHDGDLITVGLINLQFREG